MSAVEDANSGDQQLRVTRIGPGPGKDREMLVLEMEVEMDDAQQLSRLMSKAGRLGTALEAADKLDAAFTESVRAMLEGTGKPVTPDDVIRFSGLIEKAKGAQAEQLRDLASTIDDIVKIIGNRPS